MLYRNFFSMTLLFCFNHNVKLLKGIHFIIIIKVCSSFGSEKEGKIMNCGQSLGDAAQVGPGPESSWYLQ